MFSQRQVQGMNIYPSFAWWVDERGFRFVCVSLLLSIPFAVDKNRWHTCVRVLGMIWRWQSLTRKREKAAGGVRGWVVWDFFLVWDMIFLLFFFSPRVNCQGAKPMSVKLSFDVSSAEWVIVIRAPFLGGRIFNQPRRLPPDKSLEKKGDG